MRAASVLLGVLLRAPALAAPSPDFGSMMKDFKLNRLPPMIDACTGDQFPKNDHVKPFTGEKLSPAPASP